MTQEKNNILDWTLYALDKMRLIHFKKGDIAEAEVILGATELYEQGIVDVVFRNGEPIFSMTPEARIMMDVMKGTDSEEAATAVEDFIANFNGEESRDESE